jgi:hypothetical protein
MTTPDQQLRAAEACEVASDPYSLQDAVHLYSGAGYEPALWAVLAELASGTARPATDGQRELKRLLWQCAEALARKGEDA